LEELRDIPIVGDIRYKGLMAGIELVCDRDKCIPYVPKHEPLAVTARRYGLYIRPLGNVVTLFPMLNAERETLRKMFEALRQFLMNLY
jgi:adenosylmethionine-8-amino-7-oxononanoate aminotransferase